MLRRPALIILSFLVLSIFLISFTAHAAPVGKITRLEGKVDVLKAGQKAPAGVSLGDNVDVGDIYRAKTNSRAEITFFNKNILRIFPATRVQISQYSDDGTRSNQIMKMDRGKVEASSSQEFVKKVSSFAEGNKFEVHTPNAVAGIRGSGMTVGFAQMVTGLFFSRGLGYFYNPNQPAVVRNVSAGFVSFIVGMGGLPSRPVPGNASYIGGSGGTAPGTIGTANGTATSTNLNLQLTSVTNPIDQTLTTTPPPQVPNVFVGCNPLMTGSFGNSEIGMNIAVNNVKFYGPSTVGQPTNWQADSVTGNFWNFDGVPNNFGIPISGNGMSAYVRISGSDTDFTGTWTASIANGSAPAGVGDYKQAFTFSGTASGTWSADWSSTGTLTGNASGVVPSVLTQDPVVTQAIQVGAISELYFSGSDYIALQNVKFWGPSTGAQPYSWTAQVDGSRSISSTTTSYALTSPGMPMSTANFVFNSVNGGSWNANVYNGNVPAGGMGPSPNNQAATSFDGRASGTYTIVGGWQSITGTASGKAR